jgi:hypothetical protein
MCDLPKKLDSASKPHYPLSTLVSLETGPVRVFRESGSVFRGYQYEPIVLYLSSVVCTYLLLSAV